MTYVSMCALLLGIVKRADAQVHEGSHAPPWLEVDGDQGHAGSRICPHDATQDT